MLMLGHIYIIYISYGSYIYHFYLLILGLSKGVANIMSPLHVWIIIQWIAGDSFIKYVGVSKGAAKTWIPSTSRTSKCSRHPYSQKSSIKEKNRIKLNALHVQDQQMSQASTFSRKKVHYIEKKTEPPARPGPAIYYIVTYMLYSNILLYII